MMRFQKIQRRHISSFRIPLLLLLFLFFAFAIAVSADATSNDEKLANLQNKIETIQKELEQDNKQKDLAVYKLKTVEKQIASQITELRSIDNQLNQQQQKLYTLTGKQRNLENQLTGHRDQLRKQMQSSYAMGKQEYVKLLLNQQNPSDIARMVVYYQYFNKSRMERIKAINSGITSLHNISNRVRAQSNQLHKLKSEAVEKKALLDVNHKQRHQLVAALTSQLKTKDQVLNKLLRDEQHLKRLLNQLEHELKDVQLDLTPPKEFISQRGKLPWPTQGKMTARFGSSRHTGDLKWQGVMIQTKAGDAIQAIAYGRVIFADWLRGFGMLMIVDHGKGYMSLYGHNQQLHKKLGDWVQANEIIATAGNTGGQITSSLYFEIRHNGVPQNPTKWCKSLPYRS